MPDGPRRSRIARQVRDFHRAYGLPLADVPSAELPAGQVRLRQDLIDEELGELRAASAAGDLVGVADALADLVYVAYGTALVYGIDLDAVLDEVHASNMTKLGSDGLPVRRADGKVLKGPGYRPPDIAGVLAATVSTGGSSGGSPGESRGESPAGSLGGATTARLTDDIDGHAGPPRRAEG